MTTLYRRVLIETAEQAEALPVGTIALLPIDRSHRQVLTKTIEGGPGPWELDMRGYSNRQVVGWTALVPIEAEEETTGALVNRVGEIRWEESRRLVTSWEPVS